MSTGENLLHVLNTLESRSVVLEAELREIDDDILLNATRAPRRRRVLHRGRGEIDADTGARSRALARHARARATRDARGTCRAHQPCASATPLTDAPATASQLEKQQRLAEIRMQLQQTSQSVRQGKQLLGSLADNYGNATVPEPTMMAGSPERPPASTPGVGAGGDLPSPTRIDDEPHPLREARQGIARVRARVAS